MNIDGVKRISSHPFGIHFKKHYCPHCSGLLTTTKKSKVVNSKSEEAGDFDFSSGDTFLKGNIKFIWTDLKCSECGKEYTIDEIVKNEKVSKK